MFVPIVVQNYNRGLSGIVREIDLVLIVNQPVGGIGAWKHLGEMPIQCPERSRCDMGLHDMPGTPLMHPPAIENPRHMCHIVCVLQNSEDKIDIARDFHRLVQAADFLSEQPFYAHDVNKIRVRQIKVIGKEGRAQISKRKLIISSEYINFAPVFVVLSNQYTASGSR